MISGEMRERSALRNLDLADADRAPSTSGPATVGPRPAWPGEVLGFVVGTASRATYEAPRPVLFGGSRGFSFFSTRRHFASPPTVRAPVMAEDANRILIFDTTLRD